MFAPFIAWLKGNPGISPDLLPVIALSVGPTPLLPSTEWQAEHCCWKAILPAAASCANAPGTTVPNRNGTKLRRRARFMVSSAASSAAEALALNFLPEDVELH